MALKYFLVAALFALASCQDPTSEPESDCPWDEIGACLAPLLMNAGYEMPLSSVESIQDLKDFCEVVRTTDECLGDLTEECMYNEIHEVLSKRASYRFMCEEDTLTTIEENWDCMTSEDLTVELGKCNSTLVGSLDKIDWKNGKDETDNMKCWAMWTFKDCHEEANGKSMQCMQNGDVSHLLRSWVAKSTMPAWEHHDCKRHTMTAAATANAAALTATVVAALFALL